MTTGEGASSIGIAGREFHQPRTMPEGQTCSAGVCRWDGEESAEKLTARADTALYADAGRDQVSSG